MSVMFLQLELQDMGKSVLWLPALYLYTTRNFSFLYHKFTVFATSKTAETQ